MKRRITIIAMIMLILALVGCGTKGEITEKLPYDKVISYTELRAENTPDVHKQQSILKKELIKEKGLSPEDAQVRIDKGEFLMKTIELGRDINYDENKKPHKLTADIILWHSGDYFSVCGVKNIKIEPITSAIEFANQTAFYEKLDTPLNKIYDRTEAVNITLVVNADLTDKDKNEETKDFQSVAKTVIVDPIFEE
ncbi:MAG: hypothetical protein RSC31_02055 [Anaerovoracaceae bacterium]